jgi:hypothetical protein
VPAPPPSGTAGFTAAAASGAAGAATAAASRDGGTGGEDVPLDLKLAELKAMTRCDSYLTAAPHHDCNR